MDPTVRLVSFTHAPIETLVHLWEQSRTEGETISVDDMVSERIELEAYPNLENHPYRTPDLDAVKKRTDERLALFCQIMDADIPVAENVSFTFMLDNVSVALREQLVRHRIGAKAGERLGMDYAPGLHDSTWWAQSMRILDMGKFAENGKYLIPETIKDNKEVTTCFGMEKGRKITVPELYKDFMMVAGKTYENLVKAGVPMEDARNVIPLAATHRISWTLNLAALKHIVGKRGCWILQLGIWKSVIVGMIEAIAKEVHPVFRRLISPPCMKGNRFTGCHFEIDNKRRIDGLDEIPACSLYLHEESDMVGEASQAYYEDEDDARRRHYVSMVDEYSELWGRDPYTGKLNG